MTEYTAVYSLPYQTATDAPCDAPEVWCDLATRVAAAMEAIDLTIGRIHPAVPAVSVAYTAGTLTIGASTAGPVPIDTVEYDTDGMFDPDFSVYRVRPRRTGWWYFTASARFQDGAPSLQEVQFYLTSDTFGTSPVPGSLALGSIANDDTPAFALLSQNWVRTSVILRVVEADLSGLGYGIGFQTGTLPMTVQGARLGAYYLRDL